jgi:hypothetical protein
MVYFWKELNFLNDDKETKRDIINRGGLNKRWNKYIKCWNYYMEGGKMHEKRKNGR